MRGSSSDRPTLGAAAIGFSLFGVSDLLYVLTLVENGRFDLGTRVDLGWIAGYALIAWAVRNPRAVRPPQSESLAESSPVLGTATVFGVFVISGALSLFQVSELQSTIAAEIWA